MTERWEQRVDRELAPAKKFVSVVPMWIRIVAIAGSFGAALYLMITDRQPYRAIANLFGSVQIGAIVTWLIFLVPCVAGFHLVAWLIHRRRRKQDFPRAVVRR